MSDEQDEWFRAASGSGWAIAGGLIAAAVVVLDAVSDWHPAVTAGAILVAVLTYAAFLRPKVGVTGDRFELHNMYSTQTMPLAAVESVAVGRTLAAYVGGRTYVSAAVGRSLRASVRPLRPDGASDVGGDGSSGLRLPKKDAAKNYADFVEERLTSLARDARDRAGIKAESGEQFALAEDVRRTWDWPLIAVTVAVAVVVVVLLVIG